MGVVNLLVQVQTLKREVEFTIYNCPSTYNVIIGSTDERSPFIVLLSQEV